MHIVVLGAGAIGSVFGGLLAQAGHHVTLIGRPAHMEAIQKKGLLIDGIWGEYRISSLRCCTQLQDMPEAQRAACEAALVTVKSYDTERVMAGSVGLLPASAVFVSLQNGLGNIECIAAHAGPGRVIGGRVIFGVVFIEAGHVRVTVEADTTALGVPEGGRVDPSLVETLAGLFTAAGLATVVTGRIEELLWAKMLYNCSLNALATILDTHYGALTETGLQDAMRRIVAEVFGVAAAAGITLPYAGPEDYCQLLFGELIPRTFDHVPSMLQDIKRGKKTEIDSLNGYIAALGRQHGCAAPCNSLVAALVTSMETLNRRSG